VSGRIDRCFSAARGAGRKVLIPFITAGDPDPGETVALMHTLVEAGADLIELGVPFSDPMADGPVIQASSERAIEKGVRLADVLKWVAEFREQDPDTPVVLMGYMNPFERFGTEPLAREASRAGVDGLLMVDCPPEEMQDLHAALVDAGVAVIRLVAPTTSSARVSKIAQGASGFIYYVSFRGTTGASHLDTASLEAPLAQLRSLTDLPLVVGFGIRDADSARAAARHADGIVIGSALVARLADSQGGAAALETAADFVGKVRDALDQSS
jgi:tryptophan synthase alpha chain